MRVNDNPNERLGLTPPADHLAGVRAESDPTHPSFNEHFNPTGATPPADLGHGFPTPQIAGAWRNPDHPDAAAANQTNPSGDPTVMPTAYAPTEGPVWTNNCSYFCHSYGAGDSCKPIVHSP